MKSGLTRNPRFVLIEPERYLVSNVGGRWPVLAGEVIRSGGEAAHTESLCADRGIEIRVLRRRRVIGVAHRAVVKIRTEQ